MEKSSVWDKKTIISPSVICLDMLHLEDQIKELEMSGVDMLHIDILDGYYSPSMPLGFETVRQMRKITELPFECHVMAKEPLFFIDELIDIGVQQIVFQIESNCHIDALINHIKSAGIRAGVALAPATSLSQIEYILEKCDDVLLMQINPGFASNKSEKKAGYIDKKIFDLRSMIYEEGLDTKITIDGRVGLNDIEKYGNGIVDIFIGGTTCIDRANICKSVNAINKLKSEARIS